MNYKKREECFSGIEPSLATIPRRLISMLIDLLIIVLIFYSIDKAFM
jgi:hypothetical protein